MGCIYKRKGSDIYYIKYYEAGRPVRESSKSTKISEAQRLLKLRQGQIVENRFPGLRVGKIQFNELAEDFLNDYRANGKRSLDRAELSTKHLKGCFGGMRAVAVSTDRVKSYIDQRQKEGAKNGTINRELTALRRMFNLAKKSTPPKVVNVPFIPLLEEGPARQGYFEHEEYLALRKALPAYLKPVVSMAYNTGMRREEILGLQWSQVDLMESKITLRAEDTKTKKSRVVFLTGELLEVVHFQRALRDSKFPKCPWVFFNEEGQRIGEFRKSWKSALIESGQGVIKCRECGSCQTLPPKKPISNGKKKERPVCLACGAKRFAWAGKLMHDFRRTAIRDMVRAGVSDPVAMKISGHKTRSVFERYNIVSEDDLRGASQRVSEYHAARPIQQNGLAVVHSLVLNPESREQDQFEASAVSH